MAVVGIDLGTTNTVVAAVRDGRAVALKDKVGRALLPSVVSFPPKGEPKIGYEAKDRRTIDPENTVFSIKRLIGRSWDNENVAKARQRFPFAFKEGPGKATLVSTRGVDHTLPEISALVLGRTKEIAESRLGTEVADAVITVPANFNDLQRAATKVAGRVAGLQVLRILNEPTAAALAYGFGKKGRERIAVYDFGGGTFDITLLDLNENVFEVLATAGDTFLGGDDIDRALADRMAEDLLEKHRIDANTDNLVREQLRAAAEKLKMDLSTRSMAKARVEEIGYDGDKPIHFDFTMRRADFEKLVEPMVSRTLEVCQEALEIAGASTKDLDQILLVGGSTRIPLVRRRISSYFGKMPQSRINPDEVVAIGAAIQASALEVKMSHSDLPSVPVPGARSAFPTSKSVRASEPITVGTTKMGLAGLKKTLAGATGPTTGNRKVGPAHTLSGVGPSLPPEDAGRSEEARRRGERVPRTSRGPAPGPEKRGPKTLAGIGTPPSADALAYMKRSDPPPAPPKVSPTAATQSMERVPAATHSIPNAPKGTGQEPRATPGKEAGHPEESEWGDFDDVTSIMPAKETEQHRQEAMQKAQARPKQGTWPDAAAPPAAGEPADTPASERAEASSFFPREDPQEQAAQRKDGSVVFELDDLDDEEVSAEPETRTRWDQKEEEESFDLPALTAELPVRGAPHSAELPAVAPQADLPVRADDLPVRADDLPDVPPKQAGSVLGRANLEGAEELGDSAIFSLDEDEDEEANQADAFGVPGAEAADVKRPAVSGLQPSFEDGFSDFSTAPQEAGGAVETTDLPSLSERPPATEDTFIEQAAAPPADIAPPRAPAPSGLDEVIGETLESHADLGAALRRQQTRTAATPRTAPKPAAPLLIDVTPLSLGVEVVGGYVEILIPRNSPIPCQKTRTFATTRENQSLVVVRVSQGDEVRFEDNTVLGEVQLTGLSPGPRGGARVDVTFALDESGMLQVSARDRATGKAADAQLKLVGVSDETAASP